MTAVLELLDRDSLDRPGHRPTDSRRARQFLHLEHARTLSLPSGRVLLDSSMAQRAHNTEARYVLEHNTLRSTTGDEVRAVTVRPADRRTEPEVLVRVRPRTARQDQMVVPL